MTINVENGNKIRIAKWGANKLFGDPDKRKKEMTDEELLQLFERVWQQILLMAITRADECDSDAAYRRLSEKERQYFDFDQEHREFRLKDQNIEFIAQLKPSDDDERELTQLWRISSTDINPKTLYVTFDTVQDRNRFRELANQLAWSDEDLGLHLILDFMAKLSRRR